MDKRGPPIPKAAARVGMFASAFGVFVCGWMAMQSSDWKVIVGLTVLAGLAGLAAQAFARMGR
jgi:hypothetical protein